MTDFLLELRSEEIPARMQAGARADLERLFLAQLAEAGLKAESIETYSTPRRLALIACGLPRETEAVRDERRGPRADAPDKAIEGFLGSTGLTRDQLEEREDRKGTFLFAVIDRPGRATKAVLAEAIPAIVRAFPWPKSMRWGAQSASASSLRWVRPLHGIVAILGDELVPCEIGGVASGFETLGHRFHHPGPITIGGAGDYAGKLRACRVIVDQAEREAIVREGAKRAAADAGLELVEDEGLVVENAGLTEWPVPLLGSFDPEFLDVPEEVIQLTARVNQKYFICRDQKGKLAPNFVCTANIEAADGGAAIVDGNRKVLAARLADARFFWEQDLKTPLEEHAKKLDQIVFHEKLGTVAAKVERVAELARWLVEEGIIPPSPRRGEGGAAQAAEGEGALRSPSEPPHPDPLPAGEREALADKAERAARLAKADLVTGMVGEFPELQGVMGGYYAEAQGLDPEIAAAIRDHYKPVGQGDEVPTAPVTVAVSLADKLDTLAGFFAIGEKPTGSKDPYALRRAALGVISLLMRGDIRLNLQSFAPIARAMLARDVAKRRLEKEAALYASMAAECFDDWVSGNPWQRQEDGKVFKWKSGGRNKVHFSEEIGKLADWILDLQKTALNPKHDFLDFFADRLKVQQREAGVRHDLIDAVFALGGEDDLVRLLARVKALQAFVETGDGANLLAGYKRAANILKKEGYSAPAKAGAQARTDEVGLPPSQERGFPYDPEPAEAALAAALDAAEPRAETAIAAEDFEGAMAALASLRAPIDDFFDNVTVNDEDRVKRAARLAMLDRVRGAVHRVADFSRIEG